MSPQHDTSECLAYGPLQRTTPCLVHDVLLTPLPAAAPHITSLPQCRARLESLAALFDVPSPAAAQLLLKHPALAAIPPNVTITRAKQLSMALRCSMARAGELIAKVRQGKGWAGAAWRTPCRFMPPAAAPSMMVWARVGIWSVCLCVQANPVQGGRLLVSCVC